MMDHGKAKIGVSSNYCFNDHTRKSRLIDEGKPQTISMIKDDF